MYLHGYRGLAFAGPPALVLNQLFSYLVVGFPLVILLFPDGLAALAALATGGVDLPGHRGRHRASTQASPC